MSENEKILQNVTSSMAFEGMYLTEDEKKRILLCLENKVSFDDMVVSLINKYKEEKVN